ncbi:MAG TPA: LapA family protein [Gammaproteobacteria bacterium]|jgi:putative membrane protein
MWRLLSLVIVLLVMALGFAFHLRNGEFFEVDYYVGVLDLPFSLWMFLAIALGALLGILASLPLIIRYRRDSARLWRRLRISEQELNNLRVVPMKDGP